MAGYLFGYSYSRLHKEKEKMVIGDQERSILEWHGAGGVPFENGSFAALQYHGDDEKLLDHFQTVGVHEGRQGCASFNVGVFMDWR